eukprot:gnl/MRDRNA2_/MRDRNA2_279951_c0_seq1.p1 gnl/MRDRNA2_/MRDRNA2_279951_c0~~gnl/MRDRNA2_/MRDRNA2_279951_c0_seq1.p1  ORF type:complete len:107 (-),score=14.71 gnl/MRDRNA2_/MRDRNA2_279951_c0_seq1:37-357(-)
MQGFSNLAWAFARSSYADGPLFSSLAKVCDSHTAKGRIHGQNLSNLVWAFAKVNHADSPVFMAFAAVVVQDVMSYKPGERASIAWAFATVNVFNTPLFTALVEAAS